MPQFKPIVLLLWLAALLIAGWTVAQLPHAAIVQSIAGLTAGQWLSWTAVNLLIILLLTERWQILSSLLGLQVGFGKLLCIRQAGQLVSFLTPGPQFGGEPLQVYWLYTQRGLPLHKAMLTLGLDRFFELWVNFAVLLLGLVYLVLAPAMEFAGWLHAVGILLALLLLLSLLGWLAWRHPQGVARRVDGLARYWQRHPRLRQLQSYWQTLGWQAMREDLREAVRCKKPAFLAAFAVSLLSWTLLVGELWLLLTLLDVTVNVPGFVLIFVAMRLSLLLPMPGGIGTLEASILWSFAELQLPAGAAMGLIALIRLRDVTVLLAGFICLRLLHRRENVQPAEI